MKHVLYIGWIGYNNLGDELMFACFKEQFYQLGDAYQLDVVNNEKRYLDNAKLEAYDVIVLGGGSILSGAGYPIAPYIIDTLYRALQLQKKVIIWGAGVDWVPKEYLVDCSQKQVITDSLSNAFRQKLNTVFHDSVWSGVRGPLTKQLLQDAGVTKDINISGDPAFLLPNINKTDSVSEINCPQEKIIGVNWGTSFQNIYGRDEKNVENRLAAALNQLIDQGCHIHFYLMWHADLEATKRLAAKLKDSSSYTLDEKIYQTVPLLHVMKSFACTINFKLHANYLSLAAGVPFIALGYRFKIFDFARSVGLEDMVIATDDIDLTDHILTLEKKTTTDYTRITNTMSEQQALYRLQLLEPFTHGLYMSCI